MSKELKIAFLAVLLIAASNYFGGVCERIGQGYELILAPSREILGLAVRFFLATGAVAMTAGLVAALVRPFWASFIVFALSALAMLLGWELKTSSGILATVYFIASLIYAERIARELEDRLRFSVRPISQSQSILITALLTVACGSFYSGYATEIRQRGFSIPPALVERVEGRMEKEIIEFPLADLGEAALTSFRDQFEQVLLDEMEEEVSKRLPAAQSEVIMVEFRRQFVEALDEMERETGERLQDIEMDTFVAGFREQFETTMVEVVENAIRPYEHWIPVVLAISLFSLLATTAVLLSWIPTVALMFLFPLLTALGVTRVAAETGIVRRLTLD
jgi:hypothetical protein